MSQTSERIAELKAEGDDAIARATTSAALEDVRVQFLGRKAELPNLLRSVADLPHEERGIVGKSANEARKALEKVLTEEMKIDQAARQKIASQRKIIVEGSQEWDILYRKYYNDEVKKLGL